MQQTTYLKFQRITISAMRILVLLAALAVMAALAIDTFDPRRSLSNSVYMQVQLGVCIAFLTDFFVELCFSDKPWTYFGRHIPYLLLSIPYYNILQWLHYVPPFPLSYFLTFVPTARAALALAMLIGFISKNRIIGIFASYLCIMLLINFFASMIFYECEHAVNPDVTDYLSSLWWCSLESTTLGAPFYPMTTVGKALAVILSAMGMLMFPLFTVYLTSLVRNRIVHMAPDQSPAE